METKVCTKCGRKFPATTEYFYSNKKAKYGLHSSCKVCMEEHKRKNFSVREMVGIAIEDVREGFEVGQKVKCTRYGKPSKEMSKTIKGKIIGKYPHHALVKLKNWKESFQYTDMEVL